MHAELPTIWFIVMMALADIPVAILLFFMWRHLNWKPGDTETLTRTIFVLSLSKFIFYGAQLMTVILGAFGLSYAARTPIIYMVDGSIFLMALANWYAYYVVYKLRGRASL